MAGRLRDTLSRRYRNRRPQHEQTRSARPRTAGSCGLSCEPEGATRRQPVGRSTFAYEISMQTTTHG